VTFKAVLTSLVKYLALVVLYVVLFTLGSAALPMRFDWTPPPDQQPWVLLGLLLVAFVNTLVISLVVARSGWSGWRLVAATIFAWYGTMTFMAQIESAWFGPALGIAPSLLPALFLNSIPLVVLFTPAAVLLWGKWQPPAAAPDTEALLPLSMPEWLWKLAAIAGVYVVLYLGFGYFVAWQNPALRDMYGNGANAQVFDYGRLIPFQILRGVLWALFMLPVIRMTRGPRWQVMLLVALLLSLPPTIALALPNPIMPDASVRLSHFIETSTSNFIYGAFLTWLLTWHPHPVAIDAPRLKRV
jgi:hypothetical protein